MLAGLMNKLAALAGKPPADAAAPAADPAEYSPEVVDAMAKEMPEQQGVQWAAKSARQVEGQMSPADIKATEAAEAWAANPTPETQQAAAEAAQATSFKSPGAWAAQGAAWSSAVRT